MNEDVNLSCALPHHTDNWGTIAWRKVIQKVLRLQRRIAKAVKVGHNGAKLSPWFTLFLNHFMQNYWLYTG